MHNLKDFDLALKNGISILESSQFFSKITSTDKVVVEKIYKEYLRYCYHYVSLSSSFTPLAARRLATSHIHARKWILEHSSEELGHELMALNDLKKMGIDIDTIKIENAPIGVIGYVSFFHYKVAIDNPWSAFGVLYFLEGMASELAPQVVKNLVKLFEDKVALSFFKEHGDLDVDHLSEQKNVLAKAKLTQDDIKAIERTIIETAHMKKFMLDKLIENLEL